MMLKKMIKKLLEKSPLRKSIVEYSTFCDPKIIIRDDNISKKRIRLALEVLNLKQRISAITAERAEQQFFSIISKPVVIELMKNFSKSSERLDEFWMMVLSRCDDIKSKSVSDVLKIIFVLYHGNASLEQGLSVDKQCLVENQLPKSLISQSHIYDAINLAGGVQNVEINKAIILAFRNARDRYTKSLNELQKEDKRRQFKEREKKKRVILY